MTVLLPGKGKARAEIRLWNYSRKDWILQKLRVLMKSMQHLWRLFKERRESNMRDSDIQYVYDSGGKDQHCSRSETNIHNSCQSKYAAELLRLISEFLGLNLKEKVRVWSSITSVNYNKNKHSSWRTWFKFLVMLDSSSTGESISGASLSIHPGACLQQIKLLQRGCRDTCQLLHTPPRVLNGEMQS